MSENEQYTYLEDLSKERLHILQARNKTYASDNSFVANFEDVSTIAKALGIEVSARDVAMILAILKLVRNANGVESGLTNKQRRDHIIDAGNYIDLAAVCEYMAEMPVESYYCDFHGLVTESHIIICPDKDICKENEARSNCPNHGFVTESNDDVE